MTAKTIFTTKQLEYIYRCRNIEKRSWRATRKMFNASYHTNLSLNTFLRNWSKLVKNGVIARVKKEVG